MPVFCTFGDEERCENENNACYEIWQLEVSQVKHAPRKKTRQQNERILDLSDEDTVQGESLYTCTDPIHALQQGEEHVNVC